LQVDITAWLKNREFSLKRLEEHRREGRVDQDILELLDAINSLEYAFTTSSCSGRIQIYEAREPGDKFGLRTLVKWHNSIEYPQLEPILEEGLNLWLAVLPPILHINTCSLRAAYHVLGLLKESGFKRAGIISVSRDGVVIEALGTERMEMPLKLEGRLVVKKELLPLIVERANSLLMRSKVRISKLREVILNEAPGGMDNLCGE